METATLAQDAITRLDSRVYWAVVVTFHRKKYPPFYTRVAGSRHPVAPTGYKKHRFFDGSCHIGVMRYPVGRQLAALPPCWCGPFPTLFLQRAPQQIP